MNRKKEIKNLFTNEPGLQLENMLKKNEEKAEELTMTWIQEWNRSNSTVLN